MGVERLKEEWNFMENVYKADAVCQGSLLHIALFSQAWI